MLDFPIIHMLGGRDAVYSMLKNRLGLKTSRTIDMWGHRGKISAAAITELMAEADRQGLRYSAKDFVATKSRGTAIRSSTP